MKLKHLLLVLSTALSMSANANCIESGSFQTCSDSNGNSYTVNRIGNTTYMDGSNSRTGGTWSQSSTTVGNTTFHDGRAANGHSWSGSSTNIGGTTFYNGRDSRGRSFSGTCNQFGCD
jgi:hypothetical protein